MNLSTIDIEFGARKVPFTFRDNSEGDRGVIRQIFQNEDYGIKSWHQGQRFLEYYLEAVKEKPGLIVDAGANIGAASVYFQELYPNSFVYAIEPEINNFDLLDANTLAYSNKKNFYGAVAGVDGQLYLEDPGLSDWGFRTNNDPENVLQVSAISPSTILAEMQCCNPMIFKIDVEGGEDSLFAGNTSWMQRFPLVIVELHDWLLPFAGSSRNFIKAVAEYDFDFVHRGENIFLFNRGLLS